VTLLQNLFDLVNGDPPLGWVALMFAFLVVLVAVGAIADILSRRSVSRFDRSR
jgi:hypothetical protein